VAADPFLAEFGRQLALFEGFEVALQFRLPSSGRTSRREKKSLHISNALSDPRF
jgi:hypothetical protein